ncbi:hypothetical protein PybrP1_012531 [[Pythium] brassicae (nom. inval.)]|nr:hypothetical protein PybrP1_012531 [[Pythium] brassicae (nom. inval.)]
METITPPPPDADARAVLTVGDGNFSFSLAFARRFPRAQLAASSFDSAQELAAKYPEAPRHVHQLRALGARVLHRVDATQLRASLAQAETAEVGDEEGGPAPRPASPLPARFDVVVFNHPHCGEENVRRHRSLLSHFYASARELLAPRGEIRLTLAAGQPARWEALARARRAGLRLTQQVDDVDSDEAFGLAYERKRHQNGRSFHRVLLHGERLQQQSTLFIFEREENEGEDAGTTGSQETAEGEGAIAAATVATVTPPDAPSRKRKARDAASQPFACNECEKSFKTAQGLKTHVHMVHELSGGAAQAAPVLLPCGLCDRTFKNADAQQQHRLAKHGSDPLIRPDWYKKQHEPQSAASDEPTTTAEAAAVATVAAQSEPPLLLLTCSICDLTYPTQAAFDEHWQELRPNEAAQRTCTRCGRSFDEERALRQHQNFCKAPHELPDNDNDDADNNDGGAQAEAEDTRQTLRATSTYDRMRTERDT